MSYCTSTLFVDEESCYIMCYTIIVFLLVPFTVTSESIFIKGTEYDFNNFYYNEVHYNYVYEICDFRKLIATSSYKNNYLKDGWDQLKIEIGTNADADDKGLAFIAGYMEGSLTHKAIYSHFYNTLRSFCVKDPENCEMAKDFICNNTKWVDEQIRSYGHVDPFWHQVDLYYSQLYGLHEGYMNHSEEEENMTVMDIMMLTFFIEFSPIILSLHNTTDAPKNDDRCTVLIKLLPDLSDIVISHNTWSQLSWMTRIVKKYTLPFRRLPMTNITVAGSSMSFSGYPGVLMSVDDFFEINSGMVVMETSLGVKDPSRWKYVKQRGQVLGAVRSMVAHRLASSGETWSKLFSSYNSGTYNSQWMIVDLKRFSPNKGVGEGTLWIGEQIPGIVHQADQTSVLKKKGYWGSYNVPYYKDIFILSGFQELMNIFGDWYSHDKTPRALILKRDHVKVNSIDTMMKLMRSNDYKNDPLSRCNCTPPYSAFNAISARGDLNPMNGTYPITVLGQTDYIGTDAKVTNYTLAKALQFYAVCGPTTGTDLPPFQWSKSELNNLPHRGQPDLFNFSTILVDWNF